MSDHTALEDDLRSALNGVVPENLDASQFRARLDRMLTEPTSPTLLGPGAEAQVVPLHPAEHPRRSRPSRAALAATLLACAAAVIAICLAVLPGGNDSHPDRTTPAVTQAPTAPTAIRSLLLPGTIVLHTYTGHGDRTLPVEHRVLAPHFSYSADGVCTGHGQIAIAASTLYGVCQPGGGGAFGSGITIAHNRLVIKARESTSWQLTLVIDPDLRTNGSVQTPVDADVTGPNNKVRQSGQGTAHVTFSGEAPLAAAGTRYRVRLVCHGSGVALPELRGRRANGLQTKTCFAGREYVWDYVQLTPPAVVHVVAAPGTTWSIAIDGM